ncbi:MAG: Hsp33 family molecular chaperone HslO [Ottowia sp.]|nr:Hsp33 family molecular chaperone HslO [Ottowia sp.]
MSDQLYKFLFDAAPVHGGTVRLEHCWREILARHDYPEAVRVVLGEMVAATVLLTSRLKLDGTMVMQLHGDGPIQLLVVECQSDLSLRATVTLDKNNEQNPSLLNARAPLSSLVNVHGRGRLVVTLYSNDPVPGKQLYQGVVPLTDEHGPLQTVAAVFEHYMCHSEQIDTRLWLATDQRKASGLLLQRIPENDGTIHVHDMDAWDRVCLLGTTVTSEELLEVDSPTLLRRLFLQEAQVNGASILPPQRVHFRCSCSRLRVARMLRMLGKEEVFSILSERNTVEVGCDFCVQRYIFDAVDCGQLFASATAEEGIRSAPPSPQ